MRKALAYPGSPPYLSGGLIFGFGPDLGVVAELMAEEEDGWLRDSVG